MKEQRRRIVKLNLEQYQSPSQNMGAPIVSIDREGPTTIAAIRSIGSAHLNNKRLGKQPQVKACVAILSQLQKCVKVKTHFGGRDANPNLVRLSKAI